MSDITFSNIVFWSTDLTRACEKKDIQVVSLAAKAYSSREEVCNTVGQELLVEADVYGYGAFIDNMLH